MGEEKTVHFSLENEEEMSRLDKVLQRVLRGTADKNTPFTDLCYLLAKFGFEERIKGIITFLLVIMFERSSIYSQKGIWRKAAKGNRFVVQIGGLNVVEI